MERTRKKVLIVDDSALIRTLLKSIIDQDHRLKVIGTANDPYEAREKIKKLAPDVITLDIEMPKMNGIVFLKNLMRLRPIPVVMISTLTQAGAPATLEALEMGAVDYLAKPQGEDHMAIEGYAQEICEKVYWASRANLSHFSESPTVKPPKKLAAREGCMMPGFICAIGSSTGGTEAIKSVVSQLPENSPPIVIAQHIPAAFSGSFAKRVNSFSAMTVHEAEHNQPIESGNVYLAPGHSHLKVKKVGADYFCTLDSGVEVNRHRPSVEPLFDSVLEAAGSKCMSIMLTGMGADGAEAMLRMKERGVYTVVQDERTSVVWGMPGAAFRLGAASIVLPLEKIAAEITSRAFKAS